MMVVFSATLRRSGPVAVATAFATISSSSSTRGFTRAATLIPRNLMTSVESKRRTTFVPEKSTHRNRLLDGIASRRSQSALSAATATAAVEKTIDLQKSFEITHPAYEVVQKDIVSEYGAYCTLYRHKKSGAELLSVAVDDDNKVFGITLRTPPEDSTGVPHILEHSVLCGSRKYKTKDPFVHLLKGSLQTFLNAFTYPDRTCYVVASQNEKDFYNLVNVYADAVYYPRAVSDPMVYAQEGWHLELDESNKLIYNGVV
jgi:Insulinase (Peptidase family M16)